MQEKTSENFRILSGQHTSRGSLHVGSVLQFVNVKVQFFVYVNETQYMCIDFDGHHSGGSSFVYVNDFCYYKNCLYTQRYKFSSKKKKNR